MIQHVSAFFELTGSESDALIVGKGPTFDPGAVSKFDGFVLALNETSRHVPFELAFFVDLEAFSNSLSYFTYGAHVAFASTLHHKHAPMDPLKMKLAVLPMAEYLHLYSFDLARPQGTDPANQADREGNMYPDHEPFIAISNTFEAAFHMLCLAKFKNIYSLGIDGGVEYHPLFQTPEKPRSNNPNLTQFATVGYLAGKYGVTYRRL